MIDIISANSPPARTDVLGVPVSAINMQMAVDTIARWIRLREPNYVCVTGVHGVMESWRDEELRPSTPRPEWLHPTACRWFGS